MAKDIVTKYSKMSSIRCDIVDLPMPVAALLTPRYIARHLKDFLHEKYDLILTPGLIQGDTSVIAEAVGIKAFKGPRYAADLPEVLETVNKAELSTTLPACDLLRERLRAKMLDELRKVENRREALLSASGNHSIGGLAVGKDFPMRVMAEVEDIPGKSETEIVAKVRVFVQQGADIIDLGMRPGESNPSTLAEAVKLVKGITSLPVSIDTMDPYEAVAGFQAGADLLLSVDASNWKEIMPYASGKGLVVIPADLGRNYFPKEASERVALMEQNIELVSRQGGGKVVADPVLDSVIMPGIVESLVSYYRFHVRHPDIPMLMGVANVTELMDADTVGVNALLAGMASELGVGILLTTEVSSKARGSVKELSTAVRMMYLAKVRRTVPKDLGFGLLYLKEKTFVETPYSERLDSEREVVTPKGRNRPRADPAGFVKVMVDRQTRRIVAQHFSTASSQKGTTVKGQNTLDVAYELVDRSLVSSLDHAAYLGLELGKAEIALKTGRSYVQDAPLFGETE